MSLINAKVPAVQASLNLGSGGSGSGVASVNGVSGAVSLQSTGGSIVFTPDPATGIINCSAVGGGAGGGTLYLNGSLASSAITAIAPPTSETQRFAPLLVLPLGLTPLSTYKVRVVIQPFLLTNSGTISTGADGSEFSFIPFLGDTPTSTPTSNNSLSAYSVDLVDGGLPNQIEPIGEYPTWLGTTGQEAQFNNRSILETLITATDTNLYVMLSLNGTGVDNVAFPSVNLNCQCYYEAVTLYVPPAPPS
jgi:hypothetical protein